MGTANNAVAQLVGFCLAIPLTMWIIGLCYYIPEAQVANSWTETQCFVESAMVYTDTCCPSCKNCHPCNYRIEPTCSCFSHYTCFVCEVVVNYIVVKGGNVLGIARNPVPGYGASRATGPSDFCDTYSPSVGQNISCWYNPNDIYLANNPNLRLTNKISTTSLALFIVGNVLCGVCYIIPCIGFILYQCCGEAAKSYRSHNFTSGSSYASGRRSSYTRSSPLYGGGDSEERENPMASAMEISGPVGVPEKPPVDSGYKYEKHDEPGLPTYDAATTIPEYAYVPPGSEPAPAYPAFGSSSAPPPPPPAPPVSGQNPFGVSVSVSPYGGGNASPYGGGTATASPYGGGTATASPYGGGVPLQPWAPPPSAGDAQL